MGHPRWFTWTSSKTMAPEYLSTHVAWGLRGSWQSGWTHPTVQAARTSGSSSNASRATRSRSSPLWRSWEHDRERSLHSTSVVGKEIGSSTPAKREAAIPRLLPENLGKALIH